MLSERAEQPLHGGNLLAVIGNTIGVIREYHRAKRQLHDAVHVAHPVVSEQTHDQEGNELPCVPYVAGIHLKAPLNEAEQRRFLHEYHQNVSEKFPESKFLAALSPNLAATRSCVPGQMDDIVRISLVNPLPQIRYNPNGMSEKQIKELDYSLTNFYDLCQASMRVTFLPVGVREERQLEKEPEVLRLDDNPTHTIVIEPRLKGFAQQAAVARDILDCITETRVMQDKLPPVDMPHQPR